MMEGPRKVLLAAALLAGLGFHLGAVADEEDPPTVSLTAPANNSSYIYPATITLAATAHAGESDAHIDKVEFFVNDVEIGEDSTAPYQIDYTPPATGTYTFKARAKDDHEQSTTSAIVTVTVVANQAPSVSLTSPATGSTAIAPAVFTLSASATDADGTIARVDFYNGATLIGTSTTAPYTFNWNDIPVGAYSLTAKATDDRGAQTASATVAVTVNANQPPTAGITTPVANSLYTAPASLTIAANAADSDGTIARVDFYDGATLLGTATAAPYGFAWNNIATGAHSLTVVATDNLGAQTTSAATNFTVIAPPVVNLTAPANNTVATAPASFTLTADATSAGGIVKVDFYNGATLIGSATTAPYTFNWTNVPAGSYSITAVATDGNGATTTSAPISVTSNAAPSVSLTAPAANASYTTPSAITLSVNAADTDGSISQVDFYNGAALIGTTTAAPYTFTWANAPAGNYTITAIATDNLGAATISAATNITVIAPPAVSLTAPAANTVTTAPASFTLTADATSAGGIAKVDFYSGAILIGTATAAPYTFNWTNVPAGSYSITAVATDGNGATTTSAPISVTSNAAPAISITAPAANSVVAATASLTLTADATDPDGTIAKVDFYNGTTLLGTATTAPYSYTWTNVPAGSYTITAVATDNAGAQTTSAAVAVTSNQLPTVSLTGPAANTVSVAPGSFTLTADAADVDGSIAKVDFHADGVLIGTATAAPYSYTWSNVPAGNHTLSAIATDNLAGQTTSATVPVISDALPAVSFTSPAANAVSVAPGSFTLTVDATSTTSSIAKVEYYASNAGTNTLIGTATAAPYSFTWSNVPAGSYSLTAVATDALGTTTSAAITVTSDQAPTVSLTGPAAGSQITSPNSFTLTAAANSTTSTIAKVEFYANNGTTNTLLGTATTAPYSITWANVPVGNYTLSAIATDTLGIATTSAVVTVAAIANIPPTVALTGPANGATVTVPGNFTLTATAGSTTSAVTKVDFYAIDNATNASTLVGTATQAPYTANWSNVPVGSYTLSAVATDILGAQTTSSQVSVTVNTGVAQAYYIHTDHLDTPRMITDSQSNTVWQWDNQDPFGNNMPNENPNGQGAFTFNLRFPGQYFDRETNLNYNVNRDYDPAIGRYIQSDPIGLRGGINTYAYVGGNPLGYTDLLGLTVTKVCRPVPWTGIYHCAVFVWHWEDDKCSGEKKKVIDNQYSLEGYSSKPLPQNSRGNFTWDADRDAFYNSHKRNTNGWNLSADVPVPQGLTQAEFDQAVTNQGDHYSQGDYSLFGFFGPNSNAAADNIIKQAGGNPPNMGRTPGADHAP